MRVGGVREGVTSGASGANMMMGVKMCGFRMSGLRMSGVKIKRLRRKKNGFKMNKVRMNGVGVMMKRSGKGKRVPGQSPLPQNLQRLHGQPT